MMMILLYGSRHGAGLGDGAVLTKLIKSRGTQGMRARDTAESFWIERSDRLVGNGALYCRIFQDNGVNTAGSGRLETPRGS